MRSQNGTRCGPESEGFGAAAVGRDASDATFAHQGFFFLYKPLTVTEETFADHACPLLQHLI